MKKGISYLIEASLKPKNRTSLFYGSWEYCARFYLPEAPALRGLDHRHIDHTIWLRQEWQKRSINYGGSWYSRSHVITENMIQSLHDICDFLSADQTPRKIVLCSDHIYIYANDLGLIARLARTGITDLLEIHRAFLSGTPGTVVLKNPKHKLRTYFKNQRLESGIAESVRRFLINQDDIRMSPSLACWTQQKWQMIQNHYFLDHDHDSVIMMLQMINSNIIRKTLDIEAAK